MNITYPAIITHEDDTFYIGFPDFGSDYFGTFGETIQMGKEYLTLVLEELEETKKEFPKPSLISDLKNKLDKNQEIVYISMNYEYEKSLIKISYVKKRGCEEFSVNINFL